MDFTPHHGLDLGEENKSTPHPPPQVSQLGKGIFVHHSGPADMLLPPPHTTILPPPPAVLSSFFSVHRVHGWMSGSEGCFCQLTMRHAATPVAGLVCDLALCGCCWLLWEPRVSCKQSASLPRQLACGPRASPGECGKGRQQRVR